MNEMRQMVSKLLMNKPVGKVELWRVYQEGLEPLVESNAISMDSWQYKELRLAVNGGDCPTCKNPWKLKKVKNTLAEFEYYIPGCGCYPKCPYCGKVQLREVQEELKGCTDCMGESIYGSTAYYIACGKWGDKSSQKCKARSGGRAKCSGVMAPVLVREGKDTHQCTECGRLTSYESRRDSADTC